jgi:hypothetical protein
MTQALYAHMNNKKIKIKKKRGLPFDGRPGKKEFMKHHLNRKNLGMWACTCHPSNSQGA